MKDHYRVFSKWILIIAFNLVIIIFSLEILLRLLGFQTFKQFPIKVDQIDPHSCMKPDSILGFSLLEGEFNYKYSDGYSFKAKHKIDGSRYSGISNQNTKKCMDFYGGSLFYGFGLEDSLVFTHHLQKELPEIIISNRAIFGHSLITSLKQIEQQVKKGNPPNIAVVSYASYNLPRNVYSINFRKNLITNRHLLPLNNKLQYCFARLSKSDHSKLDFHLELFDYQTINLSYYSVLINNLEELYERYEYNSYQPNVVEKYAINQIVELCSKNEIKLVFALVTKDAHTNSMKKYFTQNKIDFLDIFVDYHLVKFNLLPHDNHPNALAHEIYSQKFLSYIKNEHSFQ